MRRRAAGLAVGVHDMPFVFPHTQTQQMQNTKPPTGVPLPQLYPKASALGALGKLLNLLGGQDDVVNRNVVVNAVEEAGRLFGKLTCAKDYVGIRPSDGGSDVALVCKGTTLVLGRRAHRCAPLAPSFAPLT